MVGLEAAFGNHNRRIRGVTLCVNAGRVLERVRQLCGEYLEEIEDE